MKKALSVIMAVMLVLSSVSLAFADGTTYSIVGVTPDVAVVKGQLPVNIGEIVIEFSKEMDVSTFKNITFKTSAGAEPVGGVYVSALSKTKASVSFGELAENTAYTLTVPSTVLAADNSVLEGSGVWNYTTLKKVWADVDFSDWTNDDIAFDKFTHTGAGTNGSILRKDGVAISYDNNTLFPNLSIGVETDGDKYLKMGTVTDAVYKKQNLYFGFTFEKYNESTGKYSESDLFRVGTLTYKIKAKHITFNDSTETGGIVKELGSTTGYTLLTGSTYALTGLRADYNVPSTYGTKTDKNGYFDLGFKVTKGHPVYRGYNVSTWGSYGSDVDITVYNINEPEKSITSHRAYDSFPDVPAENCKIGGIRAAKIYSTSTVSDNYGFAISEFYAAYETEPKILNISYANNGFNIALNTDMKTNGTVTVVDDATKQTIATGTYAPSSRIITVPCTGANLDEKNYIITVAGYETNDGYALNETKEAGSKLICGDSVLKNQAGTEVTAVYGAKGLKYSYSLENKGKEKLVNSVIAVYDGDKLVKCDVAPVTVGENSTAPVEMEVSGINVGKTYMVKILRWGDFSASTPYEEAEILPLIDNLVIEAETCTDMASGCTVSASHVGGFAGGKWFKYEIANMSDCYNTVIINAARGGGVTNGTLKIRLGSVTGELVGTVEIDKSTGGWSVPADNGEYEGTITKPQSGNVALYFCSEGFSGLNMDNIIFTHRY